MSQQNSNTSNARFNPFPGLRPFTIEESHLFFGREGQSEEVLDNLAKNKFVAVVGSSGSGKSSLMYCGVVPILHGGFITEAGSRWKIVVSRPGNDPIGNLAKEISTIYTDNEQNGINKNYIQAMLSGSSNGLVEALKYISRKDDENILILADQFEELFRFRKKFDNEQAVNESHAYVRLLLEAVKQSEVPIYIVMTMRSDFIGECAQYQELTEYINQSHYLIPQMDRASLRLAITGPVAVGGGKISDRLTNELLNDLGDNPDQLPILQHALMRTWNFWMEHPGTAEQIDIEHYDSIGRMEKALSNHANEAFNELSPKEKRICENMFKTLTERGNDNRGIRHPSSVEEIAAIANTDQKTIIKIVEHFRKPGRSFLTSADNSLVAKSIIDISHESLMRIWDKLKIWVEEEALAVQMYLRLSEAAAMYQEGKIGLWRPPDLQLAINWRKEKQPTLTWAKRFSPAFERAMVYLDTSEKAHLAEEENKIRLQKKALRRSRIFAIVLGTAAIISLGFMVYAITMQAESNKQRIIAEQQREEAEKQRTEAEAQKELALKNEQEAQEQRKIALQKEKEAREQTRIAELQRQRAERSLEEARRQRKIADQKTQEATEQKQIADKKSEEALVEKNKAEKARERALQLRMLSIARSMAVKSVQMEENKDLKALLAYQAYQFNKEYGGAYDNPDIFDGLYYALKTKNDENFNLLDNHKDAVRALKIKTEEKTLYSAGSDGRVFKWTNINDSTKATEIYKSGSIIRALDFSKSGDYLFLANDDYETHMFNLKTQTDSTFKDHSSLITSLKTVGNETVITSSTDGTIVIRNIQNGSKEVINIGAGVKDFALSPDQKQIAFVTSENKAGFLSLANNETTNFYENNHTFYTISYNHRGNIVAMGSSKGTLIQYDINKEKIIREINAHNARINDLAFSRDDKLLASASFDGTIRIYDADDLDKAPIVIRDYSSWCMALTFNSYNNCLYAGYVDSNIKKWHISSMDMAAQLLPKINRDMTDSEWQTYVGKDIQYIATTEKYASK